MRSEPPSAGHMGAYDQGPPQLRDSPRRSKVQSISSVVMLPKQKVKQDERQPKMDDDE